MRKATSPTTTADRLPTRVQRRAELEGIITRAIALLDADDWDPDREDEPAECGDDQEASAQRSTLAPDGHPARVIRFPARRAVRT